jgi:hypothetical protein
MALGLYVNRMDGGPQSPSFVCDDCDKYSRISSSSVEGGGGPREWSSFIYCEFVHYDIVKSRFVHLSLSLSVLIYEGKRKRDGNFFEYFLVIICNKSCGPLLPLPMGKCRATKSCERFFFFRFFHGVRRILPLFSWIQNVYTRFHYRPSPLVFLLAHPLLSLPLVWW